MEKIFKLSENGTTVRTEIVAGLTSFMTMAYIIALNPNLLTNFDVGSPLWNGVFMATCIASAVAMFVMAFLANKPITLAPGMGLNSFFAVVVASIAARTGMSYVSSFQTALVIILIEGVLFLGLSVFNIREKIVEAIPTGIRLGLAPAIGMLLMSIGLGSNAGVMGGKVLGEVADGQLVEGTAAYTSQPFYVLRDFFGALNPGVVRDNMTAWNANYSAMVLTVVTMFLGLFVIVILAKRKVKAAVLLGMLCASAVYWAGSFLFLHTNPFASLADASFLPPVKDMVDTTLFKFNFAGLADLGWFTVVTLVITFCMIDMFDTIGALVGAASQAGMLDENGNMVKMKEALTADAVGTVVGACTGTSTVTTFSEFTAGVEAGGRTGLTALTCGVLFLASMFIAPVAAVIPPAATSPALIYVGVLMFKGLRKLDFDDIDQLLPTALMVIAMPISSSVGHAIGVGMIAYTILKVFTGRAKEVSVLTYVISALFLVKFFLIV